MPRGYTRTPEQLSRLYRRINFYLHRHTAAQTAARFRVSLATVEEARLLAELTSAEPAGSAWAQTRKAG